MQKLVSIIILCLIDCFLYAKTLSPLDFGLAEAKGGVECYNVLLKCHQEALRLGVGVDYSGIQDIHIEIPKNAIPIPLGCCTDFNGLKLYVKNNSQTCYLFTRINILKSLNISFDDFYSGSYLNIPELKQGNKILIIEDKTPWVDKRKGYAYGAIRKDIVLIMNGKVQNLPVYPYSSINSDPKISYYQVDNDNGFIKNLNFYRTEDSSCKSFLIKVSGLNGFSIENIRIFTPESELYGDAAITVCDCTNMLFKDIQIDGTYSLNNKYGYGISLDNVWNTTVENMQSESKWGVFGNNNVNKCTLKNCYINRFDIHCYGRDIYMEDCYFKGLYNQYSSVFGTISHKRCTFENAKPVLIESSYNAYTGFDVVFEDCTFKMNKKKRELIFLMVVPENVNNRPELSEKCLPNVQVNNCSFDFEEGMKEWYVFRAENKSLNIPLGYISLIDMRRIKLSNRVNCKISNIDLHSIRKVKYNIKSWKTLQGLDFKNGIVKNLNRQVVN